MYFFQGEDRFHNRKNVRLKEYDYTTPNYYFVTICTDNKKCIFGRPGYLNESGKIAEKGLKKISIHFPSVKVDKTVVMPNHIHAIIELTGNDCDLTTVVGSYKSYVTRKIREIAPNICVWQRSFHDYVIRSQKSYEKIWEYIETNPVKWEEDCFYVQ